MPPPDQRPSAHEAPSAKVTKKLEKEKLQLKEINTGSSKQGLIENSFSKPG
jgi:hypothetical protein